MNFHKTSNFFCLSFMVFIMYLLHDGITSYFFLLHRINLINNRISAPDANQKITDKGMISLATLAKLESITFFGALYVTGKAFRSFKSLKSIQFSSENISNKAFSIIAKNCLELQVLKISDSKLVL